MDVLVIFNPRASRVNDRARACVLGAVAPRHDVHAVETSGPGHAAELAAQASRDGCGLVVAVGGDGTANEAANGLIGTDTALWCLPAGSTNVFARTVGAPDRLDAASRLLADHAAAPTIRRMTTGTVDGRHFLFMSGIGVTAAIMRRAAARPVLRAKLGAGYVAFGAAAALADVGLGRLPRVEVEAGGERAEAGTVIIQRSDPLTFFGPRPVRVCPPGPLGDGTLSVAMADGARPRDVATIFRRLLTGDAEQVTDHPRVRAIERLPELTVRSLDDRPFGVEVDGTYMGERDAVTYGVAPGSLLVAGP
jgi:diacylglycerol kinase family enzyme